MVELLSPVGDFEGLASAIQGGCDSVYFGIKGLNMRSASAKNFTIDDMGEVARICHANGKKCYLTLNTLVYNHEFPRVEMILGRVKEAGVDAIIATDFGIIQKANEIGVEVHISTQASIANASAAEFYSKYSPRLVLARELSLEQIKRMKQELKEKGISVEFEVFVHGALCVAESGRCFMSQHHNRISANRGQCLQECRRAYKVTDVEDPRREFILDNNFVMSPKDLCALPILDRLYDAGIDVFKIEGRAKGPEYIYTVTKVYREAMDAVEEGAFTPEKVALWLEELSKVYNRGFTDNFLLGTPTNDSWAGIYGNRSRYVKTYVGKIVNYYAKNGIAEAELENHELCINDRIMISGPTTGYYEGEIKSLVTDDGPVERSTSSVVTFPVTSKVRKNDRLFVVKENVLTQAEKRITEYDFHEPFRTVKS
jgi:U32 family peptidase